MTLDEKREDFVLTCAAIVVMASVPFDEHWHMTEEEFRARRTPAAVAECIARGVLALLDDSDFDKEVLDGSIEERVREVWETGAMNDARAIDWLSGAESLRKEESGVQI